MDRIDDWMIWLVAVWGGLTILGVLGRKVWRKGRTAVRKVDSAVEALVGREAVRHPETGVVLVPPTPGLGTRLAHMEEAIAALADSHRQMADLSTRVDHLTLRFDQHITDSQTNEVARSSEQKAMWKAIEAIAKSEPSSA